MNFKKCFPCCPESFRTRATPAMINEETITETPLSIYLSFSKTINESYSKKTLNKK